jgi:hypothetical protein
MDDFAANGRNRGEARPSMCFSTEVEPLSKSTIANDVSGNFSLEVWSHSAPIWPPPLAEFPSDPPSAAECVPSRPICACVGRLTTILRRGSELNQEPFRHGLSVGVELFVGLLFPSRQQL